jgi:FAD/FMN-containing dehydrogenase
MADGKIYTCSRSENQQLFSLIPGGYGLFGIILAVKLKVTDNKAYRMYQYVMPLGDYLKAFRERVDNNPQIGMVYGRINVNQDNFANEAILSTFRIDDSVAIPALKAPGLSAFRRTVFRSSASSEYGKELRWRLEKLVVKLGKGKIFSRNQIMNEPVDIFQNSEAGYSDILHEYFIPADSINRFIDEIRKTIPKYKVDLMNITIRNVLEDQDTYMSYARKEVFGFVMLFNEAIDPGADREMRNLTEKLVDIAISLGGTYYLPYRLHATREQFYRAYPRAQDFFKLKRKYDPEEIFQNQFYKAYK